MAIPLDGAGDELDMTEPATSRRTNRASTHPTNQDGLRCVALAGARGLLKRGRS